MTHSSSDLPLVTGATGFAGSHLLDLLVQRHARVIGWSHSGSFGPRGPDVGTAQSADRFPHSSRVEWHQVDVLERDRVNRAIRETRPTLIYHCAGLPHVGESWSRAAPALAVNALGTHHLLEAVREYAPDCVTVLIGSASVYRPCARALREEDALAPADPYGTSKLAQEMLGLQTSTPVVVARPFNHIGPGQRPAFVTSSFARQIAEIEAGLAEPLLRVGNLDARRDMTDVRDTVRAYQALALSGVKGRVYNVCSGTAYRVGDLLERLLQLAQVPIRVEQDGSRLRPSDNPLVLGDPARIQNEIGWRPEIPIERALADLLAWWRTRVQLNAS